MWHAVLYSRYDVIIPQSAEIDENIYSLAYIGVVRTSFGHVIST